MQPLKGFGSKSAEQRIIDANLRKVDLNYKSLRKSNKKQHPILLWVPYVAARVWQLGPIVFASIVVRLDAFMPNSGIVLVVAVSVVAYDLEVFFFLLSLM